MRRVFLVAALVVIFLAILHEAECVNNKQDEKKTDLSTTWTSRYFNFNFFKNHFHKIYSGRLEESFRLGVFLAHVIHVFRHNILRGQKKKTYSLTINKFSDRTQEEIQRMYNPHRSATLVTVNDEFHAIERKRRSTNSDSNQENIDNFSRYRRKKYNLRSKVDSSIIESNDSGNNLVPTSWLYDHVMIDHFDWQSNGNCLLPISDQGGICGSCYAFASLPLISWHECRHKKSPPKHYSEQFIVDCSSLTGGHRCEGGELDHVVDIVKHIGLRDANVYPYKGRNGTCPYKDKHSEISDDITRPTWIKFSAPHRSNWIRYLLKEPMWIAVWEMTDLADYSDGIHDGMNCDPDHEHAMMLVGFGYENSRGYFVLRNSWGDDWGKQGYMRLDMEAHRRCIMEVYRIDVKF